MKKYIAFIIIITFILLWFYMIIDEVGVMVTILGIILTALVVWSIMTLTENY